VEEKPTHFFIKKKKITKLKTEKKMREKKCTEAFPLPQKKRNKVKLEAEVADRR
jgi:hypothetical protein